MKKNNFKFFGIIMALLLITACSSSNQNDTQKEYTSKSSVSESSGSTLSYGSPGEAEYYPLEHSHSVPSDLDAYVGYYTGELETASHLRYKFALSIHLVKKLLIPITCILNLLMQCYMQIIIT